MSLTDVVAALWAHKTEILLGAAAIVAAASALVKAADALVVVLVGIWPGLQPVDDELRGVAKWLDAVASSKWLNALALNKATTKALLLAFSLGPVALPAPARASGFLDAFDFGMGPTIPLLQFPLGVKAPPVQFAPGTGVQFNATPKALQFEWGGKKWDAVSLNLFLFGSLVTGSSGQQLGQLSAAVGPAFFSSAVALAIGGPMLSEGGVPFPGKPFLLLALNLNLLLQPQATAFDRATWALPRANTLYF